MLRLLFELEYPHWMMVAGAVTHGLVADHPLPDLDALHEADLLELVHHAIDARTRDLALAFMKTMQTPHVLRDRTSPRNWQSEKQGVQASIVESFADVAARR